MNKYVELSAVQKKIMERIGDVRGTYLAKDIGKIPAADVQETKHGYWIIRYEGTYKRAKCYCSVCGKPNGIGGIISNQKKPYCPNCGCKMDLEEN